MLYLIFQQLQHRTIGNGLEIEINRNNDTTPSYQTKLGNGLEYQK